MVRGREISGRLKEEQAQIVARDFLAKSFDPSYGYTGSVRSDLLPNGRIDKETRRRRDEYRNRMGAQVNKS